MQQGQVRLLKLCVVVLVIFTLILNIAQLKEDDNTIVIGTKNLTEQQIIANIYKDVIEANTSYKVRIISGLDTTSFVQNALLDNDIDMYVEYTSTAYLEIFKHKYTGQSKELINQTLDSDYEEIDLDLNSFLGFENSNAIICNSFCENINKISDLDGKSFSFAAPAYFFERSDGYKLLEEAYDFSNVEIIKADPVIIYQGIMSGQIDVGLGFTTDAKLVNDNIKVLNDSDNVFPSYDAMLVTTDRFLDKYPDVDSSLAKISGTISTTDIRKLNDEVENQGVSIEEAADEYSKEKNYVGSVR